MKETNNLKFFTGTIFVPVILVCVFTIAPSVLFPFSPAGSGATRDYDILMKDIETRTQALMEQGNIPGLGLVIVKGDRVYTRGFGYADVSKKVPVTPGTLFEVASLSKAFTALAVLQLERDGLLDLDASVSNYLPWFYVIYDSKKHPVTLRQLLHHTSGIPFRTVSCIPAGTAQDALEQTVRNLVGFELERKPGTGFEYATINYDILGAVIEAASGMVFEDYMTKHIFTPLGLKHTSVGRNPGNPKTAAGYKIGYFAPRKYDAPVFRGNNPAAYIVSNSIDMAMWLQLHMGIKENDLTPLIRETHQPDRTVPINRQNLSAYGMGWHSYMNGTDILDHAGNNPNFTAYVGFSGKEKIGVAVLANSNSNYTRFIGYTAMALLQGNDPPTINIAPDPVDKGASVVSLMLLLFLLAVIAFFIVLLIDVIRKKRQFEAVTFKKIFQWGLTLVIFCPFLYGIYLLPRAMSGVNWETALVWSPVSFKAAVVLLLAAMGGSYLMIIISSLFPQENKYKKQIPLLLVLSLATGGANAVVIFLITGSIFSTRGLFEQLYYFVLAFGLYIIGRKILQTRLVKITFDVVYDLRMNLLEKIFNTSYQKFEKIDRGRVFATLNDDTNQIGASANMFVMLITSIITIIGAFLFLATIAFWATAITFTVITIIASLYYVLVQKTRILFEDARDTQNEYMGFLNGMLDGFNELSMHLNKRREYKNDVEKVVDRFRSKLKAGLIHFINAFLVGESLLIILLGSVGFGFRWLFPEIPAFTVMSFVMILLYLIGPFNALLRAIPEIMRIRISWQRVEDFSVEIPANVDPDNLALPEETPEEIESLKAEGVMFEYHSENAYERFVLGPFDFEAKKGEIIFIIGGNGSGKTTLGKLLTGLYIPKTGRITINGKTKANYQLGEYFSAVFSDFHLFEKLYDVDLRDRKADARYYLKLLRLDQKVVLEEDGFSTVDLSGGQRKRLALLRCYLENHPIYLFDEVAADQDPEFRKFFYRELLQRMKKQGKIIIAITHDDHYFDAADRVIKMDMGGIETVTTGYHTTAA